MPTCRPMSGDLVVMLDPCFAGVSGRAKRESVGFGGDHARGAKEDAGGGGRAAGGGAHSEGQRRAA
eukprot:2121700-Rhodomonas_salina.5